MICPSCGRENPANGKFCRYCGVQIGKVVEQSNGDEEIKVNTEEVEEELITAPSDIKEVNVNENIENKGVRGIVLDLFDIKRKKGFFESLILIIFIFISIIPLYLFLPAEPENIVYYFNFLITAVIVFAVFYLKGFRWGSFVAALVAGFASYWIGYQSGMLALFYAFMSRNRSKVIVFNDLEKDYLYSLLKSGLIWYGLGSVATFVGYWAASASEGETFYIWYGAVLVGIWRLGKALYYYSRPSALRTLVNNLASSKELTDEDRARIKKKSRRDFLKFFIYGFLLLVGIIIVVAMLGV